MKVNNTNAKGKITSTKKTTAKKSAKSASGQDTGPVFSSILNHTSGDTAQIDQSTAAMEAPNSSGSARFIESFLTVTMAQQNQGKKSDQYATKRGHDLLDQLDRLRNALLMGNLTMSQLEQIQKLVSQEKANAATPALQTVLSEIELRARVEIAKYSKRQ